MCQVLASISGQSCQISKDFLANAQRSSLLPFSLSFPLRSTFLKCISNSPIRSPFSTTFLYCHPYSFFFFFGCWYFCHFLCLIFYYARCQRSAGDAATSRPHRALLLAEHPLSLCVCLSLYFGLFCFVSFPPFLPLFFAFQFAVAAAVVVVSGSGFLPLWADIINWFGEQHFPCGKLKCVFW